jgi:hypothetical protein
LTNEASSEARKAATAAISSTVPMRFIGYSPSTLARNATGSGCELKYWSLSSVSMSPGQMATQRMPSRA